MHQFDEHHPEFKGFSKFYDKDIRPALLDMQSERERNRAKARKVSTYLIPAVIALAIGVWFQQQRLDHTAIAAGVGGLIVLIINLAAAGSGTENLKAHLMTSLCRFLNWTYQQGLPHPPHLELFKANGLLPSTYHRADFEDYMAGQARGMGFEMYEAHLEKKTRDSKGKTRWVTVFRGQVMIIDCPRKFLGRTVVLRDSGIFNAGKRHGMERVGLEDPVFEKIFEAYGTDQVEARYLLTPTFMQQLVDLEDSIKGKNVRIGFVDGRLLIALETRNSFEPTRSSHGPAEPELMQELLNEIGAIYDIIEGLK